MLDLLDSCDAIISRLDTRQELMAASEPAPSQPESSTVALTPFILPIPSREEEDTLPEPLTWAEEVEITCYPAKVAVREAWDKCVAAARLATYHNLSSLEEAKKTVQYTDLARQHLILSRLAATVPWDGTPNVAIN